MPVDISKATEFLREDFEAADTLVDEIYDKYFAQGFKRISELEKAFRNTDTPVTDAQLEEIITTIPMDLYTISASLAQFKQHYEIVKLTNKQRKKSKADDTDVEYQLMAIVYNSVIDRVEYQISFTKELIMGAKKIWDARRRTDTTNPIKDTYINLPNYDDALNKGGSTNVPIF